MLYVFFKRHVNVDSDIKVTSLQGSKCNFQQCHFQHLSTSVTEICSVCGPKWKFVYKLYSMQQKSQAGFKILVKKLSLHEVCTLPGELFISLNKCHVLVINLGTLAYLTTVRWLNNDNYDIFRLLSLRPGIRIQPIDFAAWSKIWS